MAYKIEASVKWYKDAYWIYVTTDGKPYKEAGPFDTIEAAKKATDEMIRMLASVNN